MSHLPLKKCRITLRSDGEIDRRCLPDGLNIDGIYEGDRAAEDICEDVIFFSPSVRRDRPELCRAQARGVIFSSDAELFFAENRRPVFAVTGSDGKSTTATLINMLLCEAGMTSRLIGNIGEPMAAHLSDSVDCYVAELSSFMLTYCAPMVERACLTNLTPNHLDWHKSIEEYNKTKISMINSADWQVVSDENAELLSRGAIVSVGSNFRELKDRYKAELYLTCEGGYICKNGRQILALDKIERRAAHDIKNLMMAIAMTEGYTDGGAIEAVASSFCGLEHRCQRIISYGGVDYINSSVDSTPARTCETLRSLGRECVLILGGRGKGLDYDSLIPEIRKYARSVLIIGENANEIFRALSEQVNCIICEDMDEAVRRGISLAKGTGMLLLSPASTSLDRYKSYARRGEDFKEKVYKYIGFDNNNLQKYE
jgi:UDP-N-acetylmuramoylalanine--D-glutamate ligase